MSSEGQLKNKIIENLILLHKGTNLPVFMNLASATNAVIDEAKKELDLLIAGFKLNAKEDTLFQRMSIGFLEKYRKKWHGD